MSSVIQEIKKKVRDQELSFIVGAGFSKNASSQYLSWEGLLQDMIEKIYRNEIKLSHSQCKKKTTYSAYEKCYIEKLVAETGFLGIASEYVRRKGYREAIDIYIEEHIPYAKPGRDGKYLARGQEVDLSLHRKLLSLNAAGIYTFNYDNLLEAAASADQAKKSNSKKSGIARQLDAITGCLSEYRNTFSETPDALKQAVKDDSYAAPSDCLNQLNGCVEKLNASIKKELLEKHTISNLGETHASNCKKTEHFIEELFVEKVGIERQLKQIYYPVTESWEISLTNNKKSIFKLHGSLRSDSKEPYGFDGDIHRHYVITQEDYDSYATKHEAFVNLMRISLLKGVFCAIGFGGSDPNFLAWISWVRDVLENGEQNENEAKVYFIDVDVEKNPIDPDKLQLFKNHRIVYVRLKDIYKDCKSADELLNAFFNEISPDSSLHQYEEVWKKVDYGYDRDLDLKNRKYHLHDAGTGDLLRLATLNRLPPFNTYSAINRYRIIRDINTIVSLDQFDKNKARVIYAAIKGQLRPISAVCTNDAILKKTA